jgi:hypothetical protein
MIARLVVSFKKGIRNEESPRYEVGNLIAVVPVCFLVDGSLALVELKWTQREIRLGLASNCLV